MEEIKRKLTETTQTFKKLFPQQYLGTIELVKKIRSEKANKFADLEKDAPAMGRRLLEFPEALYSMIKGVLTDEEFKEVFENKNHKLIHWYAARFKEFNVSDYD